MASENPYAAPVTVDPMVNIVQDPSELRIASQGKRLLNLIIDNIATQILSGMLGLVVGIVYGASRAAQGTNITPEDEMTLQIVGMLLGFGIVIVYFAIMETLFQRSLAKFITGTRVVREDGGPPTFAQILGRTLARFIPFEAFSFLGGKGFPVGWHDSLSGTRVVTVR